MEDTIKINLKALNRRQINDIRKVLDHAQRLVYDKTNEEALSALESINQTVINDGTDNRSDSKFN